MRKRSPVAFVIFALLIVAAVIAVGSFETPRTMLALTLAGKPARLVMPVRGARTEGLVDSFQDLPGASAHRALDIFCVRGTDVLAPARGLVVSVGSNVVRLFGPGGQSHVLSNVVPRAGLAPGQSVEAGEVVGQVDDPSGAERGSTPHLHYALTGITGRAIDPYPLLASAATPGPSSR